MPSSAYLSAPAIVASFAFGIEAVMGYVLGQSSGLSEMHKSVLVAFVTLFPILTLLTLLPMAARERREAEEARLAFRRGEPAE